MIKLIASDVDGTLLNDKSQLDEKTRNAILKAQKNGIKFLICSGRSDSGIAQIFERFDFEAEVICQNGADLKNHLGEELIAHFIDEKYVDFIEEYAQKNNYIVEYHCKHNTYIRCSKERLYNEFIKFESKQKTLNEDIIDELYNEYWNHVEGRFNTPIETIKNEKVFKMEFVYLPDEKYSDIYEELSKLDLYVTSSSNFNNIELNHTKASKGNTLLEYCEMNQIANNEVVVIGDSLNDLSMFELFENSVAVANALDQIKEIAKYVTLSNDDCGVAKVIEEVVAYNEKKSLND